MAALVKSDVELQLNINLIPVEFVSGIPVLFHALQ